MTTDAESVFKSLTSRDLKTPAEKTLLGHVCWIRECLQLGLLEAIQWCDTRDMTADGHTKGCIDRQLLLDAMQGRQLFKHDVKLFRPHRQAGSQRELLHLLHQTPYGLRGNVAPEGFPPGLFEPATTLMMTTSTCERGNELQTLRELTRSDFSSKLTE